MFDEKDPYPADGETTDPSAFSRETNDETPVTHQTPSEVPVVDPMLELPEIPATTAPAVAYPVVIESEPAPKPRRGGWKMAAAAVLLVGMGAAVGSATTVGLSRSNLPIGYQAPSMTQVSAGALAAASPTLVSEVYKKAVPSVVTIKVTVKQGNKSGQATGTGFVVDPQGFILTNNHVIEGATKVTVKFVDGTLLDATVIGTDKSRDLAVLKVDPGNRKLIAAELGDSSTVQVGEIAIAIGTPFDNDFTVTSGIVSGLNRDIKEVNNPFPIQGGIQTDASINPGNSGGPLLNANGQVIGINTAIDSPVGGSVGLGFAVPVNAAKEVLAQLEAGQTVQSTAGYLGVSMQTIDETLATDLGLTVKAGVAISDVVAGSPAEKAGLKSSVTAANGQVTSVDVIVAIDGKAITTTDELAKIIQQHKSGDQVKLSVVRGTEHLEVTATLGSRPSVVPQ
jgi:S1-C subfamily serine protease